MRTIKQIIRNIEDAEGECGYLLGEIDALEQDINDLLEEVDRLKKAD